MRLRYRSCYCFLLEQHLPAQQKIPLRIWIQAHLRRNVPYTTLTHSVYGSVKDSARFKVSNLSGSHLASRQTSTKETHTNRSKRKALRHLPKGSFLNC